ncbi:vWA domain-containing protein [Gimesia fumaroli]|jgi:Flp pilus assembly protein TadG|uniref:von Willebrand factor type A domain protein n=1 Tax=Gimesia fumaroli TaxID=2527976 RepID=A0A518ICU7_9PLAN|nr:vWA domain-containing protein [Gimesia fumaroli]QDV50936.1 von Willebrand factor type A domain protein [Gimesia fumaroli]
MKQTPMSKKKKMDLPGDQNRRGAFMVMAVPFLIATMGFMAFGIDIAVITMTKTRMRNAVEAAALAAAQQITDAVQTTADDIQQGQDVGSAVQDANSIAVDAAKAMAEKVARLNGVYIDPETDVKFGKRYQDASGTFHMVWGETAKPYNVVKVIARRDNPAEGQQDSKLQLFFAGFMSDKTAAVTTSAIAFIEARDIVLVLDYSGSMSYDSEFGAMSSYSMGKPAVEANLDDIWNTLVASGATYSDTGKLKFPADGYGKIDSAEGTYISSYDDDYIFQALDLDEVDSSGNLKYPFPQEGKNYYGNLNGQPTGYTNKNLWKNYIRWVRTNSTVNNYGYRKKYGYRTLMGYLVGQRKKNNQSEDLWRAPIYPFHAMKEGVTLFTDFLDGLQFGDYIGLVTYDDSSRVESVLNDDGILDTVDLGDELITNRYADIDTIQRHKQASHYAPYTGMGYGIRDAKELLESHGRAGARPTILVMTDGNANRSPSDWSLPGSWDWDQVTDFDGDGQADYATSSRDKQYAFWQAVEAANLGYTVHTMTVGAGADRNLMQAIAKACNGIWIDAPGGATIEDMQAQLLVAFGKIAANVPPAKLLADPESDF